MMKSPWTTHLLIGFILVALLSGALSAVNGAQSRDPDDDDEDALDDPLPPTVDLRVFILRPRVVKPNHLGICSPSSNPKENNFEITRWHLSGPITWSLNRSTVPPSVAGGVDGVLNASFRTWYSGIFSQGPDTRAKRAKLDKVNAILWKRLGRSTLGVTFVWSSRDNGEVIEVDTVFNKRVPWAIFPGSPECQSSPHAYDLQNIATHEFGHWIGLDDLFDEADEDLTMYGFSAGGEVKKRTLGAGDISGRNRLEP
jgi:hypothetical protein